MSAKLFKTPRCWLIAAVCATCAGAGGYWLIASDPQAHTPHGNENTPRVEASLERTSAPLRDGESNFTAWDTAHGTASESGWTRGMHVSGNAADAQALSALNADINSAGTDDSNWLQAPIANGASPSPAMYAQTAQPAISVGHNGAIEISVPVDTSSATPRQAVVPVALALATDPTGIPPKMLNDMRNMALDFLEAVADTAATAAVDDATYFRSWQNAARQSDLEFKMRYGKVAFVQMNLLTAQEATANAR